MSQREELEALLKKVRQQVSDSPQKAGQILEEWVHRSRGKKNPSGKGHPEPPSQLDSQPKKRRKAA